MKWFLIVVLITVLTSGCSKWRKLQKQEAEEQPPPKTMTFNPGSGAAPAVLKNVQAVDRKTAANDLRNIWVLAFSDPSVPPPTSLEQFADLRKESPRLYRAVQEQHYIINWKVSRNDGNAIFAYWSGVPEQGGPVVLAGGTVVENMKAEDFKSAMKGK